MTYRNIAIGKLSIDPELEFDTLEELVSELWGELHDCGHVVIIDGVDMTEKVGEAFLATIDDVIDHDDFFGAVACIDSWEDIVQDAKDDATAWSRGADYYYSAPSRL